MNVATLHRKDAVSEAIAEQEWQSLMTDPRAWPEHDGDERRGEARVPHRELAQFVLEIHESDDMITRRFLVRTRDVSSQGIGFLHHRPVDVGADCRVSLLIRRGRLVHRTGTIAACSHRRDGHYEIGMRLRKSVVVSDFL